ARCGSSDFKLVPVNRRRLTHMIDDQDLVRQIEDEIPLIVGARQPQLCGLELEDQIISERTVEPEVLVLGAGEQTDQRAQHREYRRLPAAALLGKALRGFADVARDAARGGSFDRRCRESADRLGDRGQQNTATPVQGVDRKPAPARGEDQRRVDKSHVPARIPAGKLEARGKEHTALGVERPGERVVGWAIGLITDLSLDANAALGAVAHELHAVPLWARGAPGDPGGSALKLQRPPGASVAASIGKTKTMAARFRRATTKLLIERSKPWILD